MKDTVVFGEVKLSDLLQDIHNNTIEKRNSIDSVIRTLIPMIRSSDDAIMLAPIVREFYDVGVRNDDHMLKIATIVQRMISAESYSSVGADLDTILTDAEKAALLENAVADLRQDVKETNSELSTALTKVPTHG
jgi:hypothetical protein